MAQMFYLIGASFSDLIGSYLCDQLGRKTIHIAAQSILVVLGTVVGFAPNYTTFVIVRILCGMFTVVCLFIY